MTCDIIIIAWLTQICPIPINVQRYVTFDTLSRGGVKIYVSQITPEVNCTNGYLKVTSLSRQNHKYYTCFVARMRHSQQYYFHEGRGKHSSSNGNGTVRFNISNVM